MYFRRSDFLHERVFYPAFISGKFIDLSPGWKEHKPGRRGKDRLNTAPFRTGILLLSESIAFPYTVRLHSYIYVNVYVWNDSCQFQIEIYVYDCGGFSAPCAEQRTYPRRCGLPLHKALYTDGRTGLWVKQTWRVSRACQWYTLYRGDITDSALEYKDVRIWLPVPRVVKFMMKWSRSTRGGCLLIPSNVEHNYNLPGCYLPPRTPVYYWLTRRGKFVLIVLPHDLPFPVLQPALLDTHSLTLPIGSRLLSVRPTCYSKRLPRWAENQGDICLVSSKCSA